MHKFFDYLEPDLPVSVIRDLLGYIRRFAALFSGGVPVEGAMDGVGFCATEQDSGAVRIRIVRIKSEKQLFQQINSFLQHIVVAVIYL